MKSNFISTISKFLILVPLFFSCSSDLDFDQVNDFKIEPVFVANLAYFNVPATQLANNGSPQPFFDIKDFDVFRDKYFTDHLVKAGLDFEIENTIIRAFTIDIVLLDVDDQVLETDSYDIPAYSGASNSIKFPTEVFENQRLDLLKKTVKLGFIVRMKAGPPLDQNSTGNLKLRSSATAYMKIE